MHSCPEACLLLVAAGYAAGCGGPILRPLPRASQVAFVQFYVPDAEGGELELKYDGDGNRYFECQPASHGDPAVRKPPIPVVDREAIFRSLLDGLERTSEIRPTPGPELPPQAGPPGLELGPAAPPDPCLGFDVLPSGDDVAFTLSMRDVFGSVSLLGMAPGPPAPSPAALAAQARALHADALLRVILVPWQWGYAGSDASPTFARVEAFAEVLGYDRRGRRFLWDLFRSQPTEIESSNDSGAPGELQDLLLDFAEQVGARAGAEGFDAR